MSPWIEVHFLLPIVDYYRCCEEDESCLVKRSVSSAGSALFQVLSNLPVTATLFPIVAI